MICYEKINNIIKDIEHQIRASRIVDTVFEFETIKIVEDFRKKIKVIILKR